MGNAKVCRGLPLREPGLGGARRKDIRLALKKDPGTHIVRNAITELIKFGERRRDAPRRCVDCPNRSRVLRRKPVSRKIPLWADRGRDALRCRAPKMDSCGARRDQRARQRVELIGPLPPPEPDRQDHPREEGRSSALRQHPRHGEPRCGCEEHRCRKNSPDSWWTRRG